LLYVHASPPVDVTVIMSSATIQTDHETQHTDATLRIVTGPALDELDAFLPELVSGNEPVVADQRVLIVDELAGWGEFPVEERPAFAFENLWPELVSLEPAQREFPKWLWSLSRPSKTRYLRALAGMRRSFSSIPWAWIRPFTWGAAFGVAAVFLLAEGARQMRATNPPLSSRNMPFTLTVPPTLTKDRIVVTTPPVFRHRLDAQRPAPNTPPAPARAAAAATEVRTVAPFIGGMEITSEPAGAQVFVNGRLEGVTPLVIDGLPIGTRAVRVEAQGYIAWSSSVRVVANERTPIRITLPRR
jgi:PEGA domain-containing protein